MTAATAPPGLGTNGASNPSVTIRKEKAMAKAKVTLEQIIAAIESAEYRGFCLACGIEVDGVEPDARRYACDACGERRVYGAEEVLIMRGA
jgi:predicted RNA-binding Zn-ribbon protein involved in translation (DUF1610 family)